MDENNESMNRMPWSIGPGPFIFKEGNCAVEWENWLRGFELFAMASGINDNLSKRNWLLHYAGPKVQSVYYNLPDDTGKVKAGPLKSGYVLPDEYKETVIKLQKYFAPKQNVSYERHIFRKMSQEKDEKVDSFVMRLRIQAERCVFGSQSDANIKDQVICGCNSESLRRKILERGDTSLDTIMKVARIFEAVSEQQKSFAKDQKPQSNESQEVCEIGVRKSFKRKWNFNQFKPYNRGSDNDCSRCGIKGHKSNDSKCPAKGKECGKCGKKDHFARKCLTKPTREGNDRSEPQTKNSKQEPIHMVHEYDDYDDVFCIDNGGECKNQIWCKIGGIEIKVVVDSGSRYNIVDKETWAELKAKNIATISREKAVDVNFSAYGGHNLRFLGMFDAIIQVGERQTIAKFYVANELGKFLLGFETATVLKVLKIGVEVNNVEESQQQEFSKIKGFVIEIPMKSEIKPVQQPYRRIPAPLEKLVDQKISMMLQQGIIEKVRTSKWISPLVITPKSDNDVRLCVDMRRANEAVDRENHPLPTIEDFLPGLEFSTVFSKLDVNQAFHQLELAPGSREITTFITKRGLFRYTRLMFGINCAPEMFQKIMEQVLNGCDGCVNFSDDIVVHGRTKAQHDERLRKVLQRLKDFNVNLNHKKCFFGVPQIVFLGHHLSAQGIKPTTDKVTSVKNFREPRTAEETRSFLGLVNYVGKFIPNLSTIAEPLSKLTRSGNQFVWEKEQKEAFEQLKYYLSKETTLGYYNVNDRTQIIADASPVGLGAVLIQFKEAGPRIISYANRSLTQTERNYAQPEKEALALVWSVERFHFYVYGREFELVSDHKALETLFSPKSKPCARIERWVLRLQSYKYKVVFKPGKTNIADPLSRLIQEPVSELTANNGDDDYINWIVTHAEPKAIKSDEIAEHSLSDEAIQAVKKAIYENDWSNKTAAPYKYVKAELCFAGELLLRSTRIVLPKSLYDRTLELAHEGHPGMNVMKKRLRAKVWWPKMDEQVDNFVKKCKGCTLVSAPSPPEPLSRRNLPSAPWEHINIDFMGPLPSDHNLLMIVDYYSRYVEVKVMTKTETSDLIKRLKPIFARFGLPLSIQADRGPQFKSEEFELFCDINNVHLNNGTPYWPQENGEIERQNRSLLKRLKISQLERRDWIQDLQEYLLMYRSTPHSITMKSPAEMLFNRKIRDKLPSILEAKIDDEAVRDRDKEMKEKGKEYADRRRHAKPNDIKEGDEVVLKRQKVTNKLATTFEPEMYRVVERNGSKIRVENTETSTQYERNVAHAKKVPVGGFRELEGNSSSNSNQAKQFQPEGPLVKRLRAAPKRYGFEDVPKQNGKGK